MVASALSMLTPIGSSLPSLYLRKIDKFSVGRQVISVAGLNAGLEPPPKQSAEGIASWRSALAAVDCKAGSACRVEQHALIAGWQWRAQPTPRTRPSSSGSHA
jgi:hypothetical protein